MLSIKALQISCGTIMPVSAATCAGITRLGGGGGGGGMYCRCVLPAAVLRLLMKILSSFGTAQIQFQPSGIVSLWVMHGTVCPLMVSE